MPNFANAIAQMADAEAITDRSLPKVPGRVLHVDGDYLAYYASGNDECSPATARRNAQHIVETGLALTGSEKAVVHLTAATSGKAERYLIATVKDYQGQRTGTKPKNWEGLREYLEQDRPGFTSKLWAHREADDGIAACAQFAVNNGRLDAILSRDKDMRMLPGVHLNWTQNEYLTTVPADAFGVWGDDGDLYGPAFFWKQMLMGDTADNIPGLEFTYLATVAGKEPKMTKVGAKTAEKILQGIDNNADAYGCVRAHYERGYRFKGDHGEFGADRFIEQACLLWLRRDPKATISNFVEHFKGIVEPDIRAANDRLLERVREARRELQELYN